LGLQYRAQHVSAVEPRLEGFVVVVVVVDCCATTVSLSSLLLLLMICANRSPVCTSMYLSVSRLVPKRYKPAFILFKEYSAVPPKLHGGNTSESF
jgi:hypothetical protein